MENQSKNQLTEQIADLHSTATARPMEQDRLGMRGLLATLVAVQMQSKLLEAEMAEQAEKEQGHAETTKE